MNYFNEPVGLNPKYPCGICNKNIAEGHRAIRCDTCNYKVHIKCNNTDANTYKKVKDDPQTCLKCKEENIPFLALNEQQFSAIIKRGSNIDLEKMSSIFPSNNLKSFLKEINMFNQNDTDNNEGDLNGMNCKYIDIESFNFEQKKSNLSLFHLNIASLSKHKDEFETVLAMLQYKFDIIGLTETKLIKNAPPIYDTNMYGYKCYYTPTESTKG